MSTSQHPDHEVLITIKILGYKTQALVDTGASSSFMDAAFAIKIGCRISESSIIVDLGSANSKVTTKGLTAPLRCSRNGTIASCQFHVLDLPPGPSCVLGRDTYQYLGMTLVDNAATPPTKSVLQTTKTTVAVAISSFFGISASGSNDANTPPTDVDDELEDLPLLVSDSESDSDGDATEDGDSSDDDCPPLINEESDDDDDNCEASSPIMEADDLENSWLPRPIAQLLKENYSIHPTARCRHPDSIIKLDTGDAPTHLSSSLPCAPSC